MRHPRSPLGASRSTGLALLLALQALATVFFVGDAVADLTTETLTIHIVLEAAVAFALGLGVVFGAIEMRRTLERSRRSEAIVSAARGAFAEMIEGRFEEWRLTPAECDVALLGLKGFDVAGIADIRGSATGTVRAQLTRVYAKSGVSSRAELLALFMDDLIDTPLAPPPRSAAPGTAAPEG